MREAASRGFWMTTYAPYGYKRVHVQDGPKKRPTLELEPARRRRGPAHLRHGATGQEHPRRDQDPQRRGHPHHQRQEVAQDHHPHHARQRSLHRHRGLGSQRQGRSSPCGSRTHFPAIVSKREFQKGQEAARLPRPQECPPAGPPAPTCSADCSSARPAARP